MCSCVCVCVCVCVFFCVRSACIHVVLCYVAIGHPHNRPDGKSSKQPGEEGTDGKR